jgi:murein DD-endopeptidase MepM/ murein hydrolase activator NlpD
MKNEQMTRIASGFGFRNDPFTKVRKMHNGMDFSAPPGTPIFATGDGEVTDADNSRSGYGKLIIIKHGFGYETYYAHLDDYKVRVGQKVKRGDIIGTCGNTGRSQGPHLHYEVRINDEPVNPINFFYADIKAEDYAKISELAKQNSQSLD